MLSGHTQLQSPSPQAEVKSARLLDSKYQYDYSTTYFQRPELLDHVKGILRHKWLIVGIVLAVTSFTALYLAKAPLVYEASTTIRIDEQSSTFPVNQGFVYFRSPEYWNTQIQSLQSPHLMYQVAAMLDLPNNESFSAAPKKSGLWASLRRIFRSQPQINSNQPEQSTEVESSEVESDSNKFTVAQQKRLAPYATMLSANLTIAPLENSNLVEISYRHVDPDVAVRVADAVAYVFIRNDIKRETGGSTNAADKLAREIASLQLSIRQLEEQRINYLTNHNLPLGQAKGQNLTVERMGTLSSQLLAKEYERKNLEAAYEGALKAQYKWSIPEIRDDDEIKEARKALIELQRRRAALTVTYTAEWPEVKKIDGQIKDLKADLDQKAREALAILKARYEVALAGERKLQQVYAQERATANQQNQDETMLSSLNQQLETTKQLYNTLFQHQKELEIATNGRYNNITVVSQAKYPDAPIPQSRLRKTFIAFLFSLGVGIGFAFLLNNLDNTIKSADDVGIHLQLTTLAMIPGYSTNPVRRWFGRTKQLKNGANALALTKELRSASAEAFRQLRTSLLYCSVGGPPKRILVTSGQVGDGKTTTAINTAITLGQAGADVLLVDCDLRRPRVHDHFQLPNSYGLTSYLCGQQMEIKELLHTHAEVPKLKIITSGPMPANPADFLVSEEMIKLLDTVSAGFSHVILDSPPASAFADSALLSTLVDGVVIVVSCGRSSRSVVRRVKERLTQVGARIYGVVLNYSDLEGDEYYKGYYSGYYSGDASGEKAPAQIVRNS